jgi:hypothetical protein
VIHVLLAAFFMFGGFHQAWAGLHSSHMTGFQISQCHEKICFEAKGPLGLMSLSNDFLVGQQVSLKISSMKPSRVEMHTCASFRYDLISQFLVCDNEGKDLASVTVNSDLLVRKYNLL